MESAIVVKDLVYEYPAKRALHGVSFSIEPATVTAMVGPNGAGKTTILRCLAALELPFSGSVFIGGKDTQADPRQIHQQVAYLPDFFGLYSELSVERCLIHMASIHNTPKSKLRAVVEEVCHELDLNGFIKSRAGALSRGQRQRLAIAQAIIHKPPVLLLDEPAAGLDPEARHSLSTLILKLRSKGMTIVVSSHILSELEDYSSAMLIVSDGQVLDHKKLNETTVVQKSRIAINVLSLPQNYQADLSVIDSVTFLEVTERTILVDVSGGEESSRRALLELINKGWEISSFYPKEERLQDVYLKHVKDRSKK
jgi:ABC-2 type transport system ATP-binding protein